MAATATLSTASTLSTAAVVGTSKALAGAAVGATVYGSVAAGTRSGQNNGILTSKDLLYVEGKAVVGAMDGATVGTLSKGIVALEEATTLTQAGKALLTTVVSNPQQTMTVGITTANQILFTCSVDAAVERGDPLGMVPGTIGYVMMFPLFSCAIDETTQSIETFVAQQNQASTNTDDVYLAPVGGGGVSSTYYVNGKTITFGHGGRHLEGTGLSLSKVQKTLAEEVSNIQFGDNPAYKGVITIDGVKIRFSAFQRGADLRNH